MTITSGCVEWTGPRNKRGYGLVSQGRGKSNKFRHRIEWETQRGPIPPEKPCVLHHCDNPPCYNIDHLFIGTRADNAADRHAKGRSIGANRGKTHCKRGHSLSGDNLYVQPKTNKRRCLICKAIIGRRMNADRVEANRAAGRVSNKNRTSCPQGHLYDGDNLFITKAGTRVCRTCRTETNRKADLKRRSDPARIEWMRTRNRNRSE